MANDPIKLPKKKVGRPSIELTEDDIYRAETYAQRGLNLNQIADKLGISEKTLERQKKKQENLVYAIKKGRATGLITNLEAIYQIADKENSLVAHMFLVNRFDRYRDQLIGEEQARVEAQGRDAASQILGMTMSQEARKNA